MYNITEATNTNLSENFLQSLNNDRMLINTSTCGGYDKQFKRLIPTQKTRIKAFNGGDITRTISFQDARNTLDNINRTKYDEAISYKTLCCGIKYMNFCNDSLNQLIDRLNTKSSFKLNREQIRNTYSQDHESFCGLVNSSLAKKAKSLF